MTFRKSFHLQLIFSAVLCLLYLVRLKTSEVENVPLRGVWYQIGLIIRSGTLTCIKLIGSPTNTFNETTYSELGKFMIHERTLTSEN